MYPNRYIYFIGVPVLCCITDCLISGFNNSFIFVRRLPYWLFIFCSVIHTTYFLGLLSCDSLVNFCSATFCLVCLFSSFHQRALLSSNWWIAVIVWDITNTKSLFAKILCTDSMIVSSFSIVILSVMSWFQRSTQGLSVEIAELTKPHYMDNGEGWPCSKEHVPSERYLHMLFGYVKVWDFWQPQSNTLVS